MINALDFAFDDAEIRKVLKCRAFSVNVVCCCVKRNASLSLVNEIACKQ